MAILKAFLIVLAFISVVPVPKKFLPDWNNNTLRYFCIMLPIVGALLGIFWGASWFVLGKIFMLSEILRGFIMMLLTLALTGGLHTDGLMDTCDAIFSHKDRTSKLEILSDSHVGAFAVMGCVAIFMAKSLLFAELLKRGANVFVVPVYSRLGMAVLLNNLPFAKSDGLAVSLGGSRKLHDNYLLAAIFLALSLGQKFVPVMFVASLLLWTRTCMKNFGGITGDLLGAFVEISETFMLMGEVIERCI